MQKLTDATTIQSVYQPAYEYIDGKLHLLKMCLITTHRCTLRCKHCVERTPYYAKRYHPSLDDLKAQIDAYFGIVDYTMKFDVSGGEAFIRSDLAEVIAHISKYRNQFGRVRVNTNGTILPGQDFIDAAKSLAAQFDMLIDKYSDGGKLLSREADNIAKLLDINDIRYILRPQNSDILHYGGWVDLLDLSLKHSEQDAQVLFNKCAIVSKIGFGFRLKNYVMSPCAVIQQLADLGICSLPRSQTLDFKTSSSREAKQNHLVEIFNSRTFEACRYCNGMCDDSVRIAPAEQL